MSSSIQEMSARLQQRLREGAAAAGVRGREAGPEGDLVARKADLTITHVSPWSVFKISLMLSFALGIMTVIAAVVIWFLLDSLHVFAAIQDLFVSVGSESFGSLIDYVQLDRVVSLSLLIAILNLVLLTALSTLGALLYNLAAGLVGGVKVTLTDD